MVYFRQVAGLAVAVLGGCGDVNQINNQQQADGGAIDAANIDAPVDAPIDAVNARHTVFVSSTTFPADVGGRDAFSLQCQNLATAAGLAGNFVALVHTRSNPLDNDDIAIEGPVVNTNGDLVAVDTGEFYSGMLRAGNGFTESGGAPADTIAWIGVPDGTIATCGDWGSTADNGGQVNVTTTTWLTASSAAACTLSRSVQCISE